jgi:hypothetical protein
VRQALDGSAIDRIRVLAGGSAGAVLRGAQRLSGRRRQRQIARTSAHGGYRSFSFRSLTAPTMNW